MNSRSPPWDSEAPRKKCMKPTSYRVAADWQLAMCPPSSEDSALARSTMASAFHRIIDRMRWSMASSRGLSRSSWPGGIVFRYGVVALYGTGAPFLRASTHSRVSAGSRSSSISAPCPLGGLSSIYPGAVANPLDQIASWPATAAAGVASATGLMESAGPATQPFRWASVTKLLVALTALDAVQRGLLDLDEPAGPPGATVRHLLSHASGLAFDSDAVLGPPGRRRVYSNRGIEIVADTVAARCGQRFERLLADEIGGPLGMTQTRLEGSPAWGAVGPLGDLMK